MRIFAIVSLLASILITGCHTQSTSSQPPGYYAGYLNRYTNEDQCVYSFVVPKKDRDQCPGLKSTVESMADQIKEMQRKQEEMRAMMGVIQENKQSWHKIGELEAHVRQMEMEKTTLTADRGRLQAEKDAEENRRIQLSVELEDARSQLQGLQSKHVPLEGNYTKLLDNFNRLREEMVNLQTDYDKLQADVKQLQRAKNCSTISKHLPSCAAIKRLGYTKSGYSMIDPDGEGGVDPFIVFCDMVSEPSTGISIVEHNHVSKSLVVGCEDPGCASALIDYKGVSMEQIAKLIDISIACEQFIEYECYDSKLLKDGTGWWVSRLGQQMKYWGGASPNSNMCACGEEGTCRDPNEVCNCDADSETWLSDKGYLRDKNALPVKELRFGDVSEKNGERGKSTLGALRCKWDVKYPVPSCDALENAGVTKSGDYLILRDDSDDPVKMRCRLSNAYPSGGHTNISPEFGGTLQVNNTRQHTMGDPLKPHGNTNLYVFTDCGLNHGRFGPTEQMCNHTYKATTTEVRVKDGIQYWTVPKDGRYKIEARGPAGQQFTQVHAGRGATTSGEFELPKAAVLKILVGQKGSRLPDRPFYGGSGGTFVTKFANYIDTAIMVAGGGGSGSTISATSKRSVTDASKTTDGKDASVVGTNYGHGGSDGHGGERGNAAVGNATPGGGAGLLHDGTESGDTRWGETTPAKAFSGHGTGPTAPGVGGKFVHIFNNEINGGFGGGGSAAPHAAGGGGGYSGGGGAPDEGYSGGGGSYANAQLGRSVDIVVNNDGPGIVRIEYLGPATSLRSTSSNL